MKFRRKHGGSYPRKKLNLEKERKGGQDRMERDYFCGTLVYDDGLFKRRFRMRKTYVLMVYVHMILIFCKNKMHLVI